MGLFTLGHCSALITFGDWEYDTHLLGGFMPDTLELKRQRLIDLRRKAEQGGGIDDQKI